MLCTVVAGASGGDWHNGLSICWSWCWDSHQIEYLRGKRNVCGRAAGGSNASVATSKVIGEEVGAAANRGLLAATLGSGWVSDMKSVLAVILGESWSKRKTFCTMYIPRFTLSWLFGMYYDQGSKGAIGCARKSNRTRCITVYAPDKDSSNAYGCRWFRGISAWGTISWERLDVPKRAS